MPVVDASVALKWFVEEPDSPTAHRLLEAHATALHYRCRLWHRDEDFTRLARHVPSLHALSLS